MAELSATGMGAASGKLLKSFGVFGGGIPHYQLKRELSWCGGALSPASPEPLRQETKT